MFLDWWEVVCMRDRFTCKGVLPRSLLSWVSVTTLVGIRFKRTISKGRISWDPARF